MPLKTPAKTKDTFQELDHFQFYTPKGIHDMGRANAFVEVTEWSSNLLVFLKGLKSFLNDFDNWWKQPFTNYNNMITMAQDDLAIEYLRSSLKSTPDLSEVHAILNNQHSSIQQIPTMWVEIAILQGEMISSLDTLDKFEQRF